MMRLRQNIGLKLFSLLASVLLFYYVQQERDPTVARALVATVVLTKKPPNVDVQSDAQQIGITITGRKSVVDRLKDGDVQAVADLTGVASHGTTTQVIRLAYQLPAWLHSRPTDLSIDPPVATIRIQVYPPRVRTMLVRVQFPSDPPAGFRYGPYRATPQRVTIAGRADRVDRIEQLVVYAEPSEPGAQIDGDFAVTPRDIDNDPVENVALSPPSVRVVVPLVAEPYSKTVPVSPNIIDLPTPPYHLAGLAVTPPTVKISGRPEVLDTIFTIPTMPVALHNETATRSISVGLAAPPDVTVLDLTGKPVHSVILNATVAAVTTPKPSAIPQQPPPTKLGNH